jgi:hypothetical protein
MLQPRPENKTQSSIPHNLLIQNDNMNLKVDDKLMQNEAFSYSHMSKLPFNSDMVKAKNKEQKRVQREGIKRNFIEKK